VALPQTIEGTPERLSPDAKIWPRDSGVALAPLWVGGAAVLCLLLGFLIRAPLTVISARVDVWVPYLVLGTVFPLLAAAVVLTERSGRALPAWLGIVLTALPVVAVALLAGPQHSLLALGLALGQILLCLLMAGWTGMPVQLSLNLNVSLSVRRSTPESLVLEIVSQPLSGHVKRVLVLFGMGFIAWAVALEMLTWNRLVAEIPPSWPRVLGGAIALLACCWWAFGRSRPRAGSGGRLLGGVTAVCLLGLVALAFRTDGLFTVYYDGAIVALGPFLHWGAILGPAEAVRQGGWLLWDVPFHYGFLSTLSLLALPLPNAWQSLYLFNAIGTGLQALFLFVVLRAVRPTVVGTLVAAAVSAAVIFLLVDWPEWLYPPHFGPSVGVFRYGWCYVLVAVLLLERRQAPRSRGQQGVLLAGCVSWLLAVLWSAESAFYGSAIWLPAFGLIVLRDAGVFDGARDWRRIVFWLAVPPLLLAAIVGGLVVLYRQFLGHGPDFRAYVDAALSYSNSGTFFDDVSGYMPDLVPDKSVLVLVFGLVLLVLAAAALARSPGGLREVPVAMGLALGVWAVSSYVIAYNAQLGERSDNLRWPEFVYRPLPFLVFGLGVLLGIIAPRYLLQRGSSWIPLLKMATIPLLTALLVTAYTNVAWLQYYAQAIRAEGFHGRDVTVGLPRVEPSLESLLQEAKVKASDPIFYVGAPLGDMMPAWTPAGQSEPVVVSQQWMGASLIILSVYPDARKHLYMERSTERQGGGGWLIERRQDGVVVDQKLSPDPWFFQQVDTTHTPTKIAQNGEWQLVWYEPKANAEAAALAGERSGRVPGLPADLLVNGQSLSESVLPPVWGYFGPEWSDPGVDGGPRCTSGTGTLYLFTPAPLAADLVLDPPHGGFGGTVQVAVNEGEAVVAERPRKRDAAEDPSGKAVQAPLALPAGWNTLTISMRTGDQPPADAAETGASCAAAEAAGSPLLIKTADVRGRDQ
jgi:hypothetical protein